MQILSQSSETFAGKWRALTLTPIYPTGSVPSVGRQAGMPALSCPTFLCCWAGAFLAPLSPPGWVACAGSPGMLISKLQFV